MRWELRGLSVEDALDVGSAAVLAAVEAVAAGCVEADEIEMAVRLGVRAERRAQRVGRRKARALAGWWAERMEEAIDPSVEAELREEVEALLEWCRGHGQTGAMLETRVAGSKVLEIAGRFGVSKGRVSQVIQEAVGMARSRFSG